MLTSIIEVFLLLIWTNKKEECYYEPFQILKTWTNEDTEEASGDKYWMFLDAEKFKFCEVMSSWEILSIVWNGFPYKLQFGVPIYGYYSNIKNNGRLFRFEWSYCHRRQDENQFTAFPVQMSTSYSVQNKLGESRSY